MKYNLTCLYLAHVQFPFQREFIRELTDVVVKDRDTAIFECEVSLPNVALKWFVKGQEVSTSPKYTISMEKTVHMLRLEQARKIDAGQVKAVFYQLESKEMLMVTGMILLYV